MRGCEGWRGDEGRGRGVGGGVGGMTAQCAVHILGCEMAGIKQVSLMRHRK